MRALIFAAVAFGRLVQARDEILYTSSITYCAPPDVLLVQEFDIEYFNNNASVGFALSATNTVDDLNATASVVLTSYGSTSLNYTFDICSVLGGQFCPLPAYNFTGSAYLQIPSSIDLPIPSIAFRIPDLEAIAQLELKRVETGEVAVCLQSTLSNGWSLHQPAVITATAVFSVLSLASSYFHSFTLSASRPSVFRVLTLFSFFQHVAQTGMLHLNYPSVYVAFTTNFAWSMGQFSSSRLQSAIERMRAATGSRLSESSQAPAAYTDRTLSPYNLLAKEIDIGSFVGGTNSTTPPVVPGHSFVNPATITSSSQTLEPGISTAVNYIGIATGSAFMTVFFALLFVLLVYAGVVAASWVLLFLLDKYWPQRTFMHKWGEEWKRTVVQGVLRILQIALAPVVLFTLFQWSLHDNWLSTLLSVITILTVLGTLLYASYRVFRRSDTSATEQSWLFRLHSVVSSFKRKKPTPDDDETSQPEAATTRTNEAIVAGMEGALTGPFLPTRRYFFFIMPFAYTILKAFIIVVARSSGFAQVVILLLFEFILFALLITLRPSHTKRGDVLEVFLSIVRIITTAALFAFAREKLSVDAIPRVAVGIGIAVVSSVGAVVLILNGLWDMFPWTATVRRILGKKTPAQPREEPPRDDSYSSVLEKGTTSPARSDKESPRQQE